MSITSVIAGVDTDSIALLFNAIDPDNWVKVAEEIVNSGRETTYQWSSGEAAYPTTVRIGSYPKADVTNFSVRYNGYVKATDSVSGLDTYSPISAVMAYTMPVTVGFDATTLADLLQNMLSWFIASTATPHATTGAAATEEWIEDSLRGLTSRDFTDAARP